LLLAGLPAGQQPALYHTQGTCHETASADNRNTWGGKMVTMDAVVLILSDARGVYIPRDFLTDDQNDIAWDHCKAWGLTEENAQYWTCAADPDSEFYWEDWDWILANAKYVSKEGGVYYLYQDGDLWGLCYNKMTPEEKRNFDMEDDDVRTTEDTHDG
jgi:hypothetical protein